MNGDTERHARVGSRAAFQALVVAGGLVVAASAASADPAPPTTAQAATAQASTAPASATDRQILAATEAHIRDLHKSLSITPSEEPAWSSFTAVMRANALDLTAKLDARQQGFATMNAVQDLTSYADVTELHAQQITKLVGPFQALYDEFTPPQKAEADRVFHHFAEKTGRSKS